MRAFADLLETTTAAASSTAARNLTTTANVKAALKITDSASDTLIDALIPRATQLIVDGCRLARDAAGAIPTFGRETLRATWYVEPEFWREVSLVSVRGRPHSPAVGALVREAMNKKWFGKRALATRAATQ